MVAIKISLNDNVDDDDNEKDVSGIVVVGALARGRRRGWWGTIEHIKIRYKSLANGAHCYVHETRCRAAR